MTIDSKFRVQICAIGFARDNVLLQIYRMTCYYRSELNNLYFKIFAAKAFDCSSKPTTWHKHENVTDGSSCDCVICPYDCVRHGE